ncbi:hypothetical protein [Maridesulfovibrio hydrothermalis]|uniref:Uncharacterized protein n=1 Tax=Maridesulfovibrio hydrothermalis AM13 = DSM 14728 TaxID=1121451 RepID=L0RAE7_9BACT|nr:hypothetical protein [Maridesulfovibrio hydrothermalis]CCO23753.1 protein of unknown function [Maridesulfovibrio hydrothermalis AM13 = DSM 14728]
MNNSLEQALREVMKIEKERLSNIQQAGICNSADPAAFSRLAFVVKPMTLVLLGVSAILVALSVFLAFSSMNQTKILNSNIELRAELEEKKSTENKPKAPSAEVITAGLQVKFGNHASKGSLSKYFKYSKANGHEIIFDSNDPVFEGVVAKNNNIYLHITIEKKISFKQKYMLLEYLAENFPAIKFISKSHIEKNITLEKSWVEWDEASVEDHEIIIPLNLDFKKFKGIVLTGAALVLPHSEIKVDI